MRSFNPPRSFTGCSFGLRRERGIALLECLVAMLIFSFGVLGLAGLEARSITSAATSEDRNRAALLAGEIATQMWLSYNVNPAAFTPAGVTSYAAILAIVSNPTVGGLQNGAVTITTPVGGNTNVADIKITWHPPSDNGAAQDSVLTTRVTLP